MTSLTPRSRLYEVLIRFNADGSYFCHQRHLTEYMREDGEIEPGLSKVGHAVVLDPAAVDGLISAQSADMMAHHATVLATIEGHLRARQDAEAAFNRTQLRESGQNLDAKQISEAHIALLERELIKARAAA